MAEQKTKPTAETFEHFLARAVEPSRHADCRAVAAMMEKISGEVPVMWGAIVGFGTYRYKYASGHSGEWPRLAFSPRKKDLTVYLAPSVDQYPELLGKLGSYRNGKVCLYVRSLAEVDLKVLEQLLMASKRAMDQLYPA
jgi:hypothetical protein